MKIPAPKKAHELIFFNVKFEDIFFYSDIQGK